MFSKFFSEKLAFYGLEPVWNQNRNFSKVGTGTGTGTRTILFISRHQHRKNSYGSTTLVEGAGLLTKKPAGPARRCSTGQATLGGQRGSVQRSIYLFIRTTKKMGKHVF
jgi:hypothetical protein